MKMEVRCCCTPRKLLGWLDVKEGLRPGDVANFMLMEKRLTLEGDTSGKFEVVQLPIQRIAEGSKSWLALKSEETPIEKLRKIPGFKESI